jgi:uncharacterized protein
MARECGSCTACCELLEVVELKKPRGVLCQHCTIGKGCAIYETRPEVCRDYECGWLAHDYIPDELRPDRCGFILDTTHDKRVMLIHVNERKMREQRRRVTQLYKFAERIVRSGKPVVFFNPNTPQEIRVWPCVGLTKDGVLEILRQDRLARQQRRRSRAGQVAVEQEA